MYGPIAEALRMCGWGPYTGSSSTCTHRTDPTALRLARRPLDAVSRAGRAGAHVVLCGHVGTVSTCDCTIIKRAGWHFSILQGDWGHSR